MTAPEEVQEAVVAALRDAGGRLSFPALRAALPSARSRHIRDACYRLVKAHLVTTWRTWEGDGREQAGTRIYRLVLDQEVAPWADR